MGMHWKKWFRFEAGRVDYMAFEWWIMRAALAWFAVQASLTTNSPRRWGLRNSLI